MAKIYGQLEVAQMEILSSAPPSPQKGLFYFDSTLVIPRLYNGTAWISLSAAESALGGPGIVWENTPGGPLEAIENTVRVYKFQSGQTQKLSYFLKVPEGYTAGSQISIVIGLYSTSASGTVFMQTTATLIRVDTDAVDSTTNQRNSSNSALTNNTANGFQKTSLDLTNSSGEINSLAASPGDLIKVDLFRGTDTDSADVNVIASTSEISIG